MSYAAIKTSSASYGIRAYVKWTRHNSAQSYIEHRVIRVPLVRVALVLGKMYCDGFVCSAGDRAANGVDSIWENVNYLMLAGCCASPATLHFGARNRFPSRIKNPLEQSIYIYAMPVPISIDREDTFHGNQFMCRLRIPCPWSGHVERFHYAIFNSTCEHRTKMTKKKKKK